MEVQVMEQRLDASAEERKVRSVSHKGEKVCSYTVDFKLEVVRYAEQSSIHAAGRKYNVSRSSVRDWKKKKIQLKDLRDSSSTGAHRRRLSGGGRKVFDSSTEKNLIDWIAERKRLGLTISGALIIKKAKALQQEKLLSKQQNGTEGPVNGTLTYSRGWLEKFMNRNGLVLKNVPTYRTPVENTTMLNRDMNRDMNRDVNRDVKADVMANREVKSDTEARGFAAEEDSASQDSSTEELIDVVSTTSTLKLEPDNNQESQIQETLIQEKVIKERHESRASLHKTICKIEESRRPEVNGVYDAPRNQDRSPVQPERRTSPPVSGFRPVHTMAAVVPSQRSLCRSPINYPSKKTATEELFIRTSSANGYPKSRICTLCPCASDSTSAFYKTHSGRDSYPYLSPKHIYYKARMDSAHRTSYLKVREDNTKDIYYSAPRSPPLLPSRQKSRFSENLAYSLPSLHYERARDLYTTYTTSGSTYHRPRNGDSYYEKTREHSNPIVIPLDDILPNDNKIK